MQHLFEGKSLKFYQRFKHQLWIPTPSPHPKKTGSHFMTHFLCGFPELFQRTTHPTISNDQHPKVPTNQPFDTRGTPVAANIWKIQRSNGNGSAKPRPNIWLLCVCALTKPGTLHSIQGPKGVTPKWPFKAWRFAWRTSTFGGGGWWKRNNLPPQKNIGKQTADR